MFEKNKYVASGLKQCTVCLCVMWWNQIVLRQNVEIWWPEASYGFDRLQQTQDTTNTTEMHWYWLVVMMI